MSDGQLRPIPVETSDIDRFVLSTDLVAVGAFRCPADHPRFDDTGPIRNHCVVFPRTSSIIQPEGDAAFVGDQSVVAVYNPGQAYQRRRLSPAGDRCDYFAIAEEPLREAMGRRYPAARDRQDVFDVSHVPGRSRWYYRQRQIFRRAESGDVADPLPLEEAVLLLVEDIIDGLGRADGPMPARRGIRAAHRELVERVLSILAERATTRLTLADLARMAGASPFHLCRVFRRVTGMTVHQRREQIRLARALEMVEDFSDLTNIAHDVGYSSHSHFTAAFSRAYGATPSQARSCAPASAG